MSDEIDVVVAGLICLDLIPEFRRDAHKELASLLKPGGVVEVGPVTVATGGAVSNTGLALHKLGLRMNLIARIGADAFGVVVREIMRGYGLDKGLITAPGEQTSYSFVLAPPGIDRIILNCAGCNNSFAAGDIDYAACGKARLFHLGYPAAMRRLYADGGRELVEIYRRVRELGAITSLDTSLPDSSSEAGRLDWESILAKVLPYVDIFMPSAEEALFMLMRRRYDELISQNPGADIIDGVTGADLQALSDKGLKMGAGVVVIKVSHRGLYLRTTDAETALPSGARSAVAPAKWTSIERWQASFRAPTFASAAGAGDASVAGFLAALLRGHDPTDCLRSGCVLGWQNVQAMDAVSGTKRWEEARADVQRGIELNPLDPGSDGWLYDARERIWLGPRDRARKASSHPRTAKA